MLKIWQNNRFSTWRPNLWDGLAFLIVIAVFALLAYGAKEMATPYQVGQSLPIHLAPKYLPYYALRTVLRLLIAMFFSLLFTFTIATLAAKNKHAERIIIPAIDVLQSVPILGFLSITVVIFIALFRNSMLGPEFAAIFAIFTAQVWNIALGFYQSLKTLPYELREASKVFHLSAWQRFWRVEVPFAVPSLIWNIMLSMSASWFFVVASEAITVNHQHILLPGVGSYIAEAIYHADKTAVFYAVLTMLLVILLYDQLIFRPLVQWSERFKFESNLDDKKTSSLFVSLLNKASLIHYAGRFFAVIFNAFANLRFGSTEEVLLPEERVRSRAMRVYVLVWYGLLLVVCAVGLLALADFIFHAVTIHQAAHVVLLGLYTCIRVIVLIIICSLVWVPIGVWVGMNPRLTQIVQPIAQFLASFPANLLFPAVVIVIIKYHLNVQIWTTPLMILGTQWYILFNVIAGASALPKELYLATKNFNVTGWLKWRRLILPAIFPYYVTGAMTAAGGAWNASIVAEVVSWGSHTLRASGLGAYITTFTSEGDFPKIALGIAVMCLYVLVLNRLVWQPLYNLAQKRYQLY
jgi:NitT/TauT family transport system permease protein